MAVAEQTGTSSDVPSRSRAHAVAKPTAPIEAHAATAMPLQASQGLTKSGADADRQQRGHSRLDASTSSKHNRTAGTEATEPSAHISTVMQLHKQQSGETQVTMLAQEDMHWGKSWSWCNSILGTSHYSNLNLIMVTGSPICPSRVKVRKQNIVHLLHMLSRIRALFCMIQTRVVLCVCM